MTVHQKAIEFFIKQDVLQFGDFTLKSGRKSPYFFNTGRLCSGYELSTLGVLYAELIASTPTFKEATVIFGSAYKGIPIAVSTSIAMSSQYNNSAIRSVSDRKEAKTHGDVSGFLGVLKPGDKVVIVDDVITTGGTKYESIDKLTQAGCEILGVVIAFDRKEPISASKLTAKEEFEQKSRLPVYSLCTIDDVVQHKPEFSSQYDAYLVKVLEELVL
jgi:orotate phosphoribosyltransferase